MSFSLNDEIIVQKIKNIKIKKNLVLEVGIFFLPTPVGDKGRRPRYPKVCVLLDHASGLVISFKMFQDMDKEGFKCIELLVEFILGSGGKPTKMLVAGDEAYYMFIDVCRVFEIGLKKVDGLDFVEQVKNGMSNNSRW